MKKITLIVFTSCLLLFAWQGNAQFSEDFTIDPGWTVIDADGQGNTWAYQSYGYMRVTYESSAHEDYLITPQFTVTSGTSDRLSLDARNFSSSFVDEFDILLSTTGNAAADFTTVIASNLAPSSTSWDSYTYDLSAYNGQTVYIAFKAISADKYYLYIDNVVVDAAPSCLEPSSIGYDSSVSPLTATSASLVWTAGASETAWEIVVQADGIGTPAGSGTAVATTAAYSATGLTESTPYEVYYRADCTGGDYSAWVGPIDFTTPASCLTPSAMAAANITTTSTDLTWTASATGETAWEIVVQADGTGTPAGSGTAVATTAAYSATGLTAFTNYEVYYRADCSGGDYSAWVGPVDFFTGHCASVPSSNDGSGITNVQLGTTDFATTDVTYADHTGTVIDIQQTATQNLQVTFATGYGYDTNVWIDLDDDLVFDSSELLFSGESSGSSPTTFDASFLVPATAPLGNHKMRIGTADSGQSTPNPCYNGTYGVTIDMMVNVVVAPSCVAPTSLTATSITTTSADLGWTAGDSETAWDIEWGATGFTQGTGTMVTGATVNPHALSGLTANTTYDFYVRADCTGGVYSAWVGPVDFTTPCDAFTSFPYLESFEGITTGAPDCWSVSGTTPDLVSHWYSYVTGQSGRGMSFDSYYNSSGNTSELSTPPMDLSGLSTAELKFQYKNPAGGNFEVLISTDGGASFTSLETGLTGQSSWTEKSYIITSSISSSVIVKFHGTSNYGNGDANIYLDEVSIAEITATTWTGATDNDYWATAGNWSTIVPTSGIDVTIPTGSSVTIGAGTAAVASSVAVASGASLMVASGGSLTGDITYTRGGLGTDWHLVSSPVVGETVEDVILNTSLATGTENVSNLGLSTYNNTTPAWEYYTSSSTGSMASGAGYAIQVTTGDVAFTGTMPIGAVNAATTDGANGWNLIGNPYPSYIAVNSGTDQLISSISDMDTNYPAVYFWDASTSEYLPENLATDARYVSPGQAFFVKVNPGVSSFSITEAMQSHQASEEFSRTTDTTPMVTLIVADEGAVKATMVKYFDTATTGLDVGYDAGAFNGVASSFKLSTHLVADSQGIDFALQTLSSDAFETNIVPVSLTAVAGKEISFSATAANLPSDMMVFLEDREANVFTRLDEAGTVYTVTLAAAQAGIGRFYLHTSVENRLGVDTVDFANVSIYATDSNTVRITGLTESNANIQIFDVLGKQLLSQRFEANMVNDIVVPNLVKTNVYLVKVSNGSGSITKKILFN
jgi:hypothetical protein